ncbi:DUF1837 domain-containing protein [Rhizobium leguminosarum]|uniref:HamA C-terminal domain-containing protein n=1 Tax=Rhizobium leguminosarum TaxID=384 RepID=UPI0010301E6F|nr:DUF1837 domain-containing protein [Rhizobium leguminosarum]TAU13818.1 DUF1837 domain-containing protein [Rhizobium leguminosarum]TAU34514.1 DUF1837 domain-containing protein [Rhizobium leguminosarum]
MTNTTESSGPELADILASLRKDYKSLSARIRALQHSITCEYEGVSLRLHYPSFRGTESTIHDLTESVFLYLTPFALSRLEIAEVDSLYGKLTADEFRLKTVRLQQKAVRLFKLAQKATNRNGEAGELLLYLLTEWVLGAPQILAKMALKTNSQMAVHGPDGVHVRFDPATQQLHFLCGESKIYSDLGKGVAAAITSIEEALDEEKLKFELELVERNIALTALGEEAKAALIRYLDPFEEESNQRVTVTTCFIAFDFDAYAKVKGLKPSEVEAAFEKAAHQQLSELASRVANSLKKAGLENHSIEFFFFPLPSVAGFRDLFQDKIGWSVPADGGGQPSGTTGENG